MHSSSNTAAQDTLRRLELQLDAAMHSLQLLQRQLETAKAIAEGISTPTRTALKVTPDASGKRDHSIWMLDESWYSKGKFPLAVFQTYVDGKYTLPKLNQDFSPDTVFSKSIRGNKYLFKLAADVSEKENDRYHSQELTTRDGHRIRVTNQVGMNNFPDLMRYLAGYFHFPIKGKDLNPKKWEDEGAPFIAPNVDFLPAA